MRRAAVRLLLAGLGLLLALAAVESTLRSLGRHGIEHPQDLFLHDEVLGWRLRPGGSGVHAGLDFRVTYRINSRGLRDREIPYEPPSPATFRILALGDSFTEGYGVEVEETFARRLESLLRRRRGSHVEVINGGVQGYSTDQELLFLFREGLRYRPQVVLLAFNDGDVNASPVAGFMGPRRYYKPFFRIDRGALVLSGVPVPRPDRSIEVSDRLDSAKRALSRFATYAWLQWHVNRVAWSPWLRALGILKRQEPGAQERPGHWDVEARVLLEMAKVVRGHGAELVIAVVGEAPRYSAAVHLLGRAHGIPVVDVEGHPRFVEAGAARRVRFQHDGHWNVHGHELAAELLSEFLVSRVLR